MTLHANGKLLLTAEYFVLDGAKALALPTKLGQSLTVLPSPDENGHWQSFDADGSMWFEADFSIKNYDILSTNNADVAKQLVEILQTCRVLKSEIATETPPQYKPLKIETHLTFPKNWGLGTSSTLIYNLAKLFNINAFDLLERAFGGSGYDIACAGAERPIFFERRNKEVIFSEVDFKPPFADSLYFVFLNQKQNSREGIARYREKSKQLPPQYFDDISALTDAFFKASSLTDFEKLIVEHEKAVGSIIDLPRAQSLYFNDFWGEIKSLGAWGGDFVLATSNRTFEETRWYFWERGFTTILKYDDLIK